MLAYFADVPLYLDHLLFSLWYVEVNLLSNDLGSNQLLFREQEPLFDSPTHGQHFHCLLIQFGRIDLFSKYVCSIFLSWKAQNNLNGLLIQE